MSTLKRVLAGSLVLVLSISIRQQPLVRVLAGQQEAQDLRTRGNQRSAAGAFDEAAGLYQKSFDIASRNKLPRESFRALINLATYHSIRFRYQKAQDLYLQAAVLADRSGFLEDRAIAYGMLGSSYVLTSDLEAASKAAEESMRLAGASDLRGLRCEFLFCLAMIRQKQGRLPEALSYLQDAIFSADRSSRNNVMAKDWDTFGEQLLLQSNTAFAERAFVEAFRLRTLFHDRDLRLSFLRLSWLRLEQGDLRSATALMNRARALPVTGATWPAWLATYIRGRILLAAGDRRAALASFQEALSGGREFQEEAAPDGVPLEFAYQRLKQVYQDVVTTSLAEDKLGLDALEATEQDRVAAMRQTLVSTGAYFKRSTPEYWSALERLRTAQSEELAGRQTRERVISLHRELTNIESVHGLRYARSTQNISERNTAKNALSTIQKGLTADEALLSFHVGRDVSALWAVTREQVALYRLAPEGELSRRIAQFRDSVRRQSPERDSLGQVLYTELFGGLGEQFLRKKAWVISAEDSFFETPLAALVVGQENGRPVYLVERHSIVHTPSAALLNDAPQRPAKGKFVGVGDGIYNSADVRWQGSKSQGLFLAFAAPRPIVELARLAGSSQELQACARRWTGQRALLSDNTAAPAGVQLLTGRSATRNQLQAALEEPAEVLHIAAHFVVSPGRPLDALIDLGLDPQGRPELLNEKDVAGLQARDTTVVMSGCSSGETVSLVTSGILGLTRAWLIAGARAVIGASWAVADDTGELFGSFYGNLRARRDRPARMRAVAESLQAAQVEMIRTNSWRSDPAYWGAFYVVGRD